jgi:hypothetical protein
MALFIDSGPVSAEDFLRHVPQGKWRELMLARRSFLEVKLAHDCRCLVQFVADAEQMFAALGFADVEEMIRDGYGLDPSEVDIAVKWLKLRKPDEAVPFSIPLKSWGTNRYSRDSNTTSRNKTRGKEYTIARLQRDRPDLAERVIAGELSANAAAIQAGFRKKPIKRCPHCGHEW